jgi:hypothetical protein
LRLEEKIGSWESGVGKANIEQGTRNKELRIKNKKQKKKQKIKTGKRWKD